MTMKKPTQSHIKSLIGENVVWRTAALWGAGVGYAILLCVAGASFYRFTGSADDSVAFITVFGMATAFGVFNFLRFVTQNLTIGVQTISRSSCVVGAVWAGLALFAISAVYALLMPAIGLLLLIIDLRHSSRRRVLRGSENVFSRVVPHSLNFG